MAVRSQTSRGADATSPEAAEPAPRGARLQWSLPPRRLAVAILTVVIAGYGVFAVVGVLFSSDSVPLVGLSLVLVVALTVVQLAYVSRPDLPPRPVRNLLVLVLQAALTFPQLLFIGPDWHGLPGLVAGSALILLPRLWGLVTGAVVVLTVVVVSDTDQALVVEYGPAFATLYVLTSTLTCAVAVYGLTTLVRLAVEADDLRAGVRRAAVSDERMRFLQRVQSLVEGGLSVMVLRARVAERLMADQPEHARLVLLGVLQEARNTLKEVRAVSRMREVAAEESTLVSATPSSRGDVAPALGKAMLTIVLVDFVVIAVGGVWLGGGPVGLALPAGVLAAGMVLYLVSARTPVLRARTVVVLGVLAVLVFAPLGVLGPYWTGLSTFLAAAALVSLPPVSAGVALVLTWTATMFAELLTLGPGTPVAYSLTYTAVGFCVATLICYGLSVVPPLVVDIEESCTELARLAILQERVRLSRDAHDLLGFSLSALTLKCELCARLLLRDDVEEARRELMEILFTAERALGEARNMVEGTGSISLVDECDQIEETLSSVVTAVRVQRIGDVPPEPVATVLATILREGVTNVLRHSNAARCEVTLRREGEVTVLEIVNDGVITGSRTDGAGNGLTNMAQRVAAVGGHLDTGINGDIHRLRAAVPVRE